MRFIFAFLLVGVLAIDASACPQNSLSVSRARSGHRVGLFGRLFAPRATSVSISRTRVSGVAAPVMSAPATSAASSAVSGGTVVPQQFVLPQAPVVPSASASAVSGGGAAAQTFQTPSNQFQQQRPPTAPPRPSEPAPDQGIFGDPQR